MKQSVIFLLSAALAFISCNEIKDTVDDIQKDESPTYVESKDGLKITVSYAKDGISAEVEAKFKVDKSEVHLLSDTVCTSFITKNSYALETAAKQAYEKVNTTDNDKLEVSLNGKTITMDYKEYVGVEKPLVRETLKSMFKIYEVMYSGGNPYVD